MRSLFRILYRLAAFVFPHLQPRHAGNVSLYDPDVWRVIEALERGERAKAPARE